MVRQAHHDKFVIKRLVILSLSKDYKSDKSTTSKHLVGNKNIAIKIYKVEMSKGLRKVIVLILVASLPIYTFSQPKQSAQKNKMGFTHVWFTGVIEHATMTDYSAYGIKTDDPDIVKGRAGSPYAIKDYYDIDPDLAVNVKNRMSEYEALISRSHQNGLKVLMDFVPNHVARTYASDAKPADVHDFGQDDDRS